MKYFFAAFVVVVFTFLAVKHKVIPALRGVSAGFERGKGGHVKIPEASGSVSPDAPPAPPDNVPGITFRQYPSAGGGFTYFEVMAFSRDVEESDSAFAERISLHLARAAGEINGKGYPFTTSYIPLSGTLVVLLSWQI